METRKYVLWLAVGCVLSCGAVAATDLRQDLEEEQFKRAGLHKLSVEELNYLQELISLRDEKVREETVQAVAAGEIEASTDAIVPVGDDRFGFEMITKRVERIFQSAEQKDIHSRITGDFRGWTGRTVFRLENGQIWQQSGSGDFYVRLQDPVVTIRRARLGGYLLSVEGYNSSVRVRRIE